MRWNGMQGLILLFSLRQCSLISDDVLGKSFLSLLLPQCQNNPQASLVAQNSVYSWNHCENGAVTLGADDGKSVFYLSWIKEDIM